MPAQTEGQEELIIIGAGVAGLSLARELARRGVDALLLERSFKVGGRCATMHEQGQAADHGVALLHGRSAPFVAALDELSAQHDSRLLLPDWPLHVRGEGTPCQPQGFDRHARRLALARGVRAFPEHLAQGLTVRQRANVERIQRTDGELQLRLEGGEVLRTRNLVLTLPAPQTAAMIAPLADGATQRDIEALTRLLGQVHLLPCLTVAAGYADRAPDTDWHLLLPAAPSPIHSVINDGSKRPEGSDAALVIQGRPAFSREALQRDQEVWGETLLAAAAELLGDWVLRPSWRRLHRWSYARVQRGDALSHPVLLRLSRGTTLGLCGDAFHSAGGIEGAYLSGLELARRITAETP